MKRVDVNSFLIVSVLLASGVAVALFASILSASQAGAPKQVSSSASGTSAGARTFDTPQQAADALIEAAGNFDVATLTAIFGPDGKDLIPPSQSEIGRASCR